MCTGTEDNLLMCKCNSNGIAIMCEVGESDCSHSEDAGVMCNGEKQFLALSE